MGRSLRLTVRRPLPSTNKEAYKWGFRRIDHQYRPVSATDVDKKGRPIIPDRQFWYPAALLVQKTNLGFLFEREIYDCTWWRFDRSRSSKTACNLNLWAGTDTNFHIFHKLLIHREKYIHYHALKRSTPPLGSRTLHQHPLTADHLSAIICITRCGSATFYNLHLWKTQQLALFS